MACSEREASAYKANTPKGVRGKEREPYGRNTLECGAHLCGVADEEALRERGAHGRPREHASPACSLQAGRSGGSATPRTARGSQRRALPELQTKFLCVASRYECVRVSASAQEWV